MTERRGPGNGAPDAHGGLSGSQGLGKECACCWGMGDEDGTGRGGGVSAHPQCSLEEGLVSSLSPWGWARWGNNGGWWAWWMVAPIGLGGFAEDQAHL